ncbi:hypothetical protein NJC38_02715 [Pseudomonas sp. 21LCFQ010]|uniref:hypothetical protein n=1 Tax=Pseudomonas sp. 21LCFQ010 TaxID=2957506 RepID=UPI0020984404|nr:hypothetical protein [Pseudomonas sp. 21LCFQ010]MCO8161063.1 hypothetical protein [Pseudomonas sp. 21LCFQ010]
MNVVEFKREGWRDAVATLRKVADQLDSGELEPCAIGVLALRSPNGRVEAFACGPAADDLQALALFRLGEQRLVDVLLDID